MRPDYFWNDRAGRYIDRRTGRFVTERQVRTWIDRAIQQSERTVARLADDVRTGRIDVGDWHRAMREEVKAMHIMAAEAATGGREHMTQADYGRVGAELREQYRHIERFARQLERGLPTDGRFLQRAGMYARSARTTYHQVEEREKAARGFNEERNVLAIADHCAGCVDASALGWVPIGTLVPVGLRDCLSQCRCRLRYRRRAA